MRSSLCLSDAAAAIAITAVLLLLLSSGLQQPVHAAPSRYKRFQALGFGVNTGNARLCPQWPYLCLDALLGECPSGRRVQLAPYFPACLDYLNPECECTESGCEMELGLKDALFVKVPHCYLGKKNLQADIEARVAVMKDAVERAYRLSDKSRSVLKIFNAPEFYFRGPTGAYKLKDIYRSSTSCCPLFEKIGKSLGKYVAQKRFQDWLFIFGTVITYRKAADKPDYEFQNFAFVMRGYDPKKTSFVGKRYIFPKRYISSVDFLEGGNTVNRSIVESPYPDKEYSTEIWDDIRKKLKRDYGFRVIENNWLSIDGILFR